MFGWSAASKTNLAKLAMVFCLLLTLFACTETVSVNAQGESATLGTSENPSSKLVLDLSIDQVSLASGKFVLLANLNNTSAKEVSFLPWANPFEENVTADFLTIIDLNAGVELTYLGIMVKRLPPKPSDYLTVGPQQAIENSVDLTTSYKFCAQQMLDVTFTGVLNGLEFQPLEVEVNGLKALLSDAFPAC
ncbi:MAG: hypothetical protein ACJAYF_001523 [Arenicella sp.]|jgi:hypothetical protein